MPLPADMQGHEEYLRGGILSTGNIITGIHCPTLLPTVSYQLKNHIQFRKLPGLCSTETV